MYPFSGKTSKNLLIFIHFSIDISPLDFFICKRRFAFVFHSVFYLSTNLFYFPAADSQKPLAPERNSQKPEAFMQTVCSSNNTGPGLR